MSPPSAVNGRHKRPCSLECASRLRLADFIQRIVCRPPQDERPAQGIAQLGRIPLQPVDELAGKLGLNERMAPGILAADRLGARLSQRIDCGQITCVVAAVGDVVEAVVNKFAFAPAKLSSAFRNNRIPPSLEIRPPSKFA